MSKIIAQSYGERNEYTIIRNDIGAGFPMWCIQIVNVCPLSVCLRLLSILFSKAWWPSARKEFLAWISAHMQSKLYVFLSHLVYRAGCGIFNLLVSDRCLYIYFN